MTASMKCELSPPPPDVVTFHLQRHGVSSEAGRAATGREVGGGASSDEVRIVDNVKPEDNWRVTYQEIPPDIIVPCLEDITENAILISVKVANTKICSVFPNIDMASKEFEDLKKPLTTRSIRHQAVINLLNDVIRMDCLAEFGNDFELVLSDKFVTFIDFMRYFDNVKRAFPSIWQDIEISVSKEDLNIVNGGMIEVGNIPCPYINRGNVMLLPAKIARLGGRGLDPSNDELILNSTCYLNGWHASPREIAYLTHICSINGLPLVFGRDTRLLPLSQMTGVYKERLIIGSSIGDGKLFKKPTNPTVSRQNGGNVISQNHQNGSITTVPGSSNGQQLVNVPCTTAVPSVTYPTPDRTVVLQNITGLRWIARPMLVNIPPTTSAAPTVPQNVLSTNNGEKRRRVEVGCN